MLDEQNKVLGEDWFIFYGQKNSPDNSINILDPDNNDDSIIHIDLEKVSPNVKKIVFILTINEALSKGYNFSQINNAYIRIVDSSINNELFNYTLSEYYSNVTAMMLGEIYKYNNTWKFNPIGDGVSKDLAGLCEMYGVETE